MPTIWWLDTLKRIEKIIRENAFGQKKKKPRLKFNPGLALIDLRTTGPGSLLKAFEKMNNKLKVRGQILHVLSVTTEWNGLCNSVSLLCDMWSMYVKCQWLQSNRELTRIFKKHENVGKTIKGCNCLASFLVLTIPRSVVRYKNGSNLNLLFERTSADQFNQK